MLEKLMKFMRFFSVWEGMMQDTGWLCFFLVMIFMEQEVQACSELQASQVTVA